MGIRGLVTGEQVTNGPGRVVMLVGNFVGGDSRVQKEARSAAAADWETFLVGRSAGGSSSGKREDDDGDADGEGFGGARFTWETQGETQVERMLARYQAVSNSPDTV